MKLRIGFVSNSSTSSFMIYGIYVEDIEDLLKSLGVKEDDIGDYYDTLKDCLKGTNLEVESMEDFYYIGRSWHSIKDNETGKQFKESVEKALKKLGINEECDTIQEAWRDG